MRRFALPLVAAALLAGCGEDDGTPAAGGSGQLAQLVIRVDDDGDKGAAPARELRLTCAAPTDSAACGAAAGVSAADLAPTSGDTACTQLYGGPETASIKGELRGSAVDASFSRTDGCEIARWEGVQDLLAEVR
jgi:hypothetical protein